MAETILACIDINDTPMAERILQTAARMATCFGGTVAAVNVVPDFGLPLVAQYFPIEAQENLLADATAALHAVTARALPDGPAVKHILAQGGIYQEVLATARRLGAKLIVIGAHRPDLGDYLLGPNAARVARHAGCSVLVVRAAEIGDDVHRL